MFVHNQRGDSIIFSILLLGTLSSLLYLFMLQCHLSLNNIKFKNQNYLCFIKLIKIHKNHYRKIAHFDLSIKAAKMAQLIPQTFTIATKTLKALILAQNLYHLSQIAKMTLIKECQKDQILWATLSLPYNMNNLKLVRNRGFPTAKKRSKTWSFWTIAISNQQPKNSFALKAKFEIKKGTLRLETFERSKEALPNWASLLSQAPLH